MSIYGLGVIATNFDDFFLNIIINHVEKSFLYEKF